MAVVRFGVATRDITPPYPVMLHGYAARDRLAGIRAEDRVSEPVTVNALCVEGSDAQAARRRVAIVALDMIGVHTAQIAGLHAAVEKATGLAPADVLIAASHTHFAPTISPQLFEAPELGIVEPDPRFLAAVTSRVVEAVRESIENLETGTLEAYRVDVPSVLFNRRTVVKGSSPVRKVETSFLYPDRPEDFDFSAVDPQLTVLRFTTPGGPKAVFVNFGCHPVTGGPGGELSHYCISADYPYYLRMAIQQAWGCPVVFSLGAAGDAVPMQRRGHAREQIGAALGCAVLLGERAFVASGKTSPDEAVVSSRTLEMEVKTILRTRGSDAQRAYEQSRKALLDLKGEPGRASHEQRQEASRDFLLKARLAYRARLYPEDLYRIRIQLLRLGETVFVGMPFEVLSEISLRIKARFPQAVVVSIANGYEGYLPLAYEYERGGYEATPESTHFEVGTADRILELVLSQLRSF